MRYINLHEFNEVHGGLSLGTVVIAVVAGFITGGPVGAGIAVSGIVAAKGIDNLNDLRNQ